jgi:hypothetical protein
VLTEDLEAIAALAESDGSFVSLSSSDPDFAGAVPHITTFYTSLILLCLRNLPNTKPLARIRAAGTHFLLEEKGKHWSFNYWKRESTEAGETPYPDDIDDTCLALAALQASAANALPSIALAETVKLLTSIEVRPGGPYRTWLVAPDTDEHARWQDIDLAVQANVALLLSLQGVALPHLTAMFEDAAKTKRFLSRYYASAVAVAYCISRSNETSRPAISRWLLATRQANGSWRNTLDTALAISTLCRGDASVRQLQKSVAWLLRQRADVPLPFGIEAKRSGTPVFSGCAALTLAARAEALNAFEAHLTANLKVRPRRSKEWQSAARMFRQRVVSLPGSLRKKARRGAETLLRSATSEEILTLSWNVWKSLTPSSRSRIPEELPIRLGYLNALGWAAYRIYDDILDAGSHIGSLPVANTFLRDLSASFRRILPDPFFEKLYTKTMDGLETAMAAEHAESRIGMSDPLRDARDVKLPPPHRKSLGHALGPATVLVAAGHARLLDDMLHFFAAYLDARQWNDDAHDWQEDLRNGRLNPVSIMVIKDFMRANPSCTQSIQEMVPALEQQFWTTAIHGVIRIVRRKAAGARSHLAALATVLDTAYLESLLAPVLQAAAAAENESRTAREFIANYGTDQPRKA